jgi:type I restriction enzyme S subunit
MDFSNGINAPKEQYGKGRKMISVMDILADDVIEYDRIINSVAVDAKSESVYKVEYGDVVFVRSSEVVSEVGWAKAYTATEYALYSGFSIRGKQKICFDNFFLELSLNFKNRKQIESKAGGSTRYNVSQSILNELIVSLPDLSEQTAIGNFFRTLDTAITLRQRKLDGLRELKKAYLQQMFPQAGERVPRVRFAGFGGEWLERRLGDVAEFSKGYGYSKADLTDNGTPIILYGRLYTNYETIIKKVDTYTTTKAQSVVIAIAANSRKMCTK